MVRASGVEPRGFNLEDRCFDTKLHPHTYLHYHVPLAKGK